MELGFIEEGSLVSSSPADDNRHLCSETSLPIIGTELTYSSFQPGSHAHINSVLNGCSHAQRSPDRQGVSCHCPSAAASSVFLSLPAQGLVLARQVLYHRIKSSPELPFESFIKVS